MEIFEVRTVEEQLDIMAKCEIEKHRARELFEHHKNDKYLAFACNDMINGFCYVGSNGDITHITALPFAMKLSLDKQMREYVLIHYKNK